MIVFSYGITKTGSTLAFELVKGCLESTGHAQPRLPDGIVEAGHPINFFPIRPRPPEAILALLDAVPNDEIVAVKTHDSFGPRHRAVIEEACGTGRIVTQVVHRDPRDTCLSMLDAGAQARELGRPAFAEFVTLDNAKDAVERQMRNMDNWLSMPNVIELEYAELALNPYRTIARISEGLGIETDEEAAHHYAFRKAFTQKNKAKVDRHRDEMAPADQASVVERFRAYMEAHGYTP